jgi:hypothetical protein
MAFKADSVASFGGAKSGIAGPNGLTRTWEGRRWTLRQDFGPSPRFGHPMCYDSKRASLVVFGGTTPGAEALLGDTWEHSDG